MCVVFFIDINYVAWQSLESSAILCDIIEHFCQQFWIFTQQNEYHVFFVFHCMLSLIVLYQVLVLLQSFISTRIFLYNFRIIFNVVMYLLSLGLSWVFPMNIGYPIQIMQVFYDEQLKSFEFSSCFGLATITVYNFSEFPQN